MKYTAVIVDGLNRGLLQNALISVASQSGEAQLDEVVIVSTSTMNIGKKISCLKKFRRIKIIIVKPNRVGRYWELGFLHATGEVLLLLDDDDRWLQCKLEHVKKLFEENPEISYYQNSIIPVSVKGTQKREARLIHKYENKRRTRTLIFDKDKFVMANQKLNSIKLHFNNSSIAVRRQVLEHSSFHIGDIEAGVDSYLFYATLSSQGTAIIDDSPLTIYGVHALNVSRVKLGESMKETMMKSRNFTSKLLVTLEGIKAKLGNNLNEHQLDLLNWDIVLNRILNNIQSNGGRIYIAKHLIGLLKSTTRINAKWSLQTVLIAIFYLINKTITRRVYSIIR